MKTIVVLQPGYLPWLGFFDQLCRSDVFVYYDDVQFDKHGWRNRNRIKSASGPLWLTVPIRHSGRHGQTILDVEIDDTRGWAKKHIASIAQCYSKAPFLEKYLPDLESLFSSTRFSRLVDLDVAVVNLMCTWLGLERTIFRSSQVGVAGGKTERLVNLCREFGATRYVSGDSAKDYLEIDLFSNVGISVEWQSYQHPTYPQLHGDFVPYLSTLDLILNTGPRSLDVIRRTL